MPYQFLSLFLFVQTSLFAQTNTAFAPSAYTIKVECVDYAHKPITLAYCFGNDYPIVATEIVDDSGNLVFSGKTKLKSGIYVLILPDETGMIDFLIDTTQHFDIHLIPPTYPNRVPSVLFVGSEENSHLSAYKTFMNDASVAISEAQYNLENVRTAADSAVFIHELKAIDGEIQQFRDSLIATYQNTFFSTLLTAMREPHLPPELYIQRNAADSLAARNYIREHFWDGVQFYDGRLAYTPFFSRKLDKYLTEIIGYKAEEVIPRLDNILLYANANDAMQHLVLDKILRGSLYHIAKWDDAVLLHIFEKYVANKTYTWLSPELRTALTERAYFLMGNRHQSAAPDMVLMDNNNVKQALYSINAQYTMLCFWDITCHHCQQTLPKVDSLLRTEWATKGIQLYAVSSETSGTRAEWEQFLETKHLYIGTHVYNALADEGIQAQKGQTYLEQYDVWYSPSFFLLDKDKHFIAKKMTFPQIVDFVKTLSEK